MLSETRDLAADKAFFEPAREVAEESPARVVIDGLRSYPRAISQVLGREVAHDLVSCCANPIEQDHRGVKQRYYPTLGFKNFDAAHRFCRVVDEVRNLLRLRQRMGEPVSLDERRQRPFFIR